MSNIKALRGQLKVSASAIVTFFAGYGRAYAQSCTAQGNTYVCSGTATTTQNLTLNSTITGVTTAPGFSIANTSGNAINITGSGTFTDTNQSTIAGYRSGVAVRSYGGPITITTTGAVSGGQLAGIEARLTGTPGDVSINATTASGARYGVYGYNSSAGGLSITTSGLITGRGLAGMEAQLNTGATGDLTIRATDVSGNGYGIRARNHGTGSIDIVTTGTVHADGTVAPPLSGNAPFPEAAITAVNFTGSNALNITSSGTLTGAHGVYAGNTGTGPTNVTVTGGVAVQSTGIFGVARNGPIDIHLTSTASMTAERGFFIRGGNGASTLTIDGPVTLNTVSGSTEGAYASHYGAGALNVTINAAILDRTGVGTGFDVRTDPTTTADSSLTVTRSGSVDAGRALYVNAHGTGKFTITVDGSVTGHLNGGGFVSGVGIGTSTASPTAVTELDISSSGTVNGLIAVNGPGQSVNYGPAIISNAGTITGGVQTSARGSVTNTGTINAGVGQRAIFSTAPTTVLNLQSGAVTGDVVVTQQSLDGGVTTINWTGGTLVGGIQTGYSDAGTATTGHVVNLTGLSAADLAGLTHLQGGVLDTLNLTNVALRGGTFNDDPTLGVAITQFKTFNLLGGAALTLTGNLSGPNLGTGTLSIDSASTLAVANGVNPVLGRAASNFSNGAPVDVVNAGTLRLATAGVAGNQMTITGAYRQTASGNLVIGVTPSAIDLLTIDGAATIDGGVTFAWAPGTYAAATRTFLTSQGLTGTFARIATADGVTSPDGIAPTVSYTETDASLNIPAGTATATATPTPTPVPTPTPTPVPTPTPTPVPTPTPTPVPTPTPTPVPTPTPTPTPAPTPVTVAPRDSRLFGTQAFAFAAIGENRASELLARTQADGGGNGFYNFAESGDQRQRAWIEMNGETLGARRTGDTARFRSSDIGAQIGADVAFGEGGRIGIAGGYDRTWLDDEAGGHGLGNVARVGVYASQTVGRIGLSAMAGYAHAWQQSRRQTGVGIATTRYGLKDLTGGAQASTALVVAGTTITPSAGVLVSRLTGDGFTEGGQVPAAFAVSGKVRSKTFVSPFARIGLSRTFTTTSGVIWVPDLTFGYRRSAAAAGSAVTLVAQDGTAFDGNRVGLGRDSVTVGAGLTAHRGMWTAFLRYRGQVAERWTEHGGSLGVRVAF